MNRLTRRVNKTVGIEYIVKTLESTSTRVNEWAVLRRTKCDISSMGEDRIATDKLGKIHRKKKPT